MAKMVIPSQWAAKMHAARHGCSLNARFLTVPMTVSLFRPDRSCVQALAGLAEHAAEPTMSPEATPHPTLAASTWRSLTGAVVSE